MSMARAKNLLGQKIGNLKTVTVKGDGTNRGLEASPNTSGIFIKKDGTIVVGTIQDAATTITLQGGSGQWQDALSQDYIGGYYTPAQYTQVFELIAFIQRYNSSVEIELNI